MVEVGEVYWSNDHAATVEVAQIAHHDGAPLVCFKDTDRADVLLGAMQGDFLKRYSLKPSARKIWEDFKTKVDAQCAPWRPNATA